MVSSTTTRSSPFLCNLCDINLNKSSDAKLYIACKIVELIYYCHNSRIVMSQHFLESLIYNYLTNSNSYSNFLSNGTP